MTQRLFQDAGGTTPAIIAGQPVGLIRRLAGSVDAVQATALSKPTLARLPKNGRRNILNWSEYFDSANWSRVGVSGSGGVFVEDVGVSEHFLGRAIGQRPTIEANKHYTVTWTIQRAGSRYIQLPGVASFGGATGFINFDLDTVSVVAQGGSFVGTISKVGDIYTIVATIRATATAQVNQPLISAVPSATSTRLEVREGDPSLSFKLLSCQLEEGQVSTQYQRIITEQDVSEAGVPDLWYLYNDGSDSLNVTLPAGIYGLASIDLNREITITTITSDGTTPINTLRHERQLDVVLRAGAFTAGEENAIRDYWGRVFA